MAENINKQLESALSEQMQLDFLTEEADESKPFDALAVREKTTKKAHLRICNLVDQVASPNKEVSDAEVKLLRSIIKKKQKRLNAYKHHRHGVRVKGFSGSHFTVIHPRMMFGSSAQQILNDAHIKSGGRKRDWSNVSIDFEVSFWNQLQSLVDQHAGPLKKKHA